MKNERVTRTDEGHVFSAQQPPLALTQLVACVHRWTGAQQLLYVLVLYMGEQGCMALSVQHHDADGLPCFKQGGKALALSGGSPLFNRLFLLCLWDNPHQKFWERCPQVRVVVRGKESTAC
eukprot:1149083-Pelagomonas_calceolata.AAC.7